MAQEETCCRVQEAQEALSSSTHEGRGQGGQECRQGGVSANSEAIGGAGPELVHSS